MTRYGRPRESLEHENSSDSDSNSSINDGCRIPKYVSRFRKKRWHYLMHIGTLFSLVAFVGFLITTIVTIVLFVVRTDNSGFELGNPEFALYKNARFKECYNTAPRGDCTAIRNAILEPSPNRPYKGYQYELYDTEITAGARS
ncbi:hypothetical protein BDW59DRAFT_167572 [Aspergillus cavernicola]|uniref:Uncharacterized protein n=1 Tax=Aspergillus cavernicola TaxID=176166 RepID=A0ABR4HCK7_9EURO